MFISKEEIKIMAKNIEMNYFNGTDYEVLYPKTKINGIYEVSPWVKFIESEPLVAEKNAESFFEKTYQTEIPANYLGDNEDIVLALKGNAIVTSNGKGTGAISGSIFLTGAPNRLPIFSISCSEANTSESFNYEKGEPILFACYWAKYLRKTSLYSSCYLFHTYPLLNDNHDFEMAFARGERITLQIIFSGPGVYSANLSLVIYKRPSILGGNLLW